MSGRRVCAGDFGEYLLLFIFQNTRSWMWPAFRGAAEGARQPRPDCKYLSFHLVLEYS